MDMNSNYTITVMFTKKYGELNTFISIMLMTKITAMCECAVLSTVDLVSFKLRKYVDK